MKFSFTLTLALLTAAVSAVAVSGDSGYGELTARDVLDIEKRSPDAFPDDDDNIDISDITDDEVADVSEEDDDDFTPSELATLQELGLAEGGSTALAIRSAEPANIEARGIKGTILKFLLKKITKSKLGKKVWNKIPKSKRKKITKYVKKAAKTKKKTTKKTKKWIAKEIKPFVLGVIASIIGKTAANIIVNDVVPWVVDAILFIIF